MGQRLPPSLVRFLDTLGIADGPPPSGDYRFKHTEPDF